MKQAKSGAGLKLAQSSAVYFHYSLEYAIRDLHELGYDGIEIWGGRPHMYRHDLDWRTREDRRPPGRPGYDGLQFHPGAVPLSLRPLLGQRRRCAGRASTYIKSAMDNAAKVGCPSVSLCPGMVLFDREPTDGWRQLAGVLGRSRSTMADKRLLLLIEPAHRFESNLILTVEDALRMIEELGSEWFGILLDTGHAHINGEDLADCTPVALGFHCTSTLMTTTAALTHISYQAKAISILSRYLRHWSLVLMMGFVSVELGGAYCLDPSKACRESLTYLRTL